LPLFVSETVRRSEEMTSPSTPTSSVEPIAQVAPGRRTVGLIIVMLIGLCLLFIAGYLQRLAEKAAVEAQIVVMEQQIAEAKVRTAILGKELAQVHDDAHIAAVARDSLNLVQEGDQLIAIVDAPAPAAPAAPAAGSVRVPVSTDPNWQRWFDLLFPAY
jgi:cell division protein FtsB